MVIGPGHWTISQLSIHSKEHSGHLWFRQQGVQEISLSFFSVVDLVLFWVAGVSADFLALSWVVGLSSGDKLLSILNLLGVEKTEV